MFTYFLHNNQILSSKLISGFVCALTTFIVAIADAAIIILTTFRKDIFYDGWYPDFIEGIMNLRGDYITVINLKKFLSLPENVITDKKHFISALHFILCVIR